MNDHETVRLLVLEDNPQDVFLLEAMLENLGPVAFQLLRAERLSCALTLLQQEPVDLVLADLNLPDSTGQDTVRALLSKAGPVPVVALTGHNDPEVGAELVRQGAWTYFCKDHLNAQTLSPAIAEALNRKHAPSR